LNDTLSQTNIIAPEINGWKMKFLFEMAYFQGRTASFREGMQKKTTEKNDSDSIQP